MRMKRTFTMGVQDFAVNTLVSEYLQKIWDKGKKVKITLESLPAPKKKAVRAMKVFKYNGRTYLEYSKDELRRRLNISYNDQKKIKAIKEKK